MFNNWTEKSLYLILLKSSMSIPSIHSGEGLGCLFQVTKSMTEHSYRLRPPPSMTRNEFVRKMFLFVFALSTWFETSGKYFLPAEIYIFDPFLSLSLSFYLFLSLSLSLSLSHTHTLSLSFALSLYVSCLKLYLDMFCTWVRECIFWWTESEREIGMIFRWKSCTVCVKTRKTLRYLYFVKMLFTPVWPSWIGSALEAKITIKRLKTLGCVSTSWTVTLPLTKK